MHATRGFKLKLGSYALKVKGKKLKGKKLKGKKLKGRCAAATGKGRVGVSLQSPSMVAEGGKGGCGGGEIAESEEDYYFEDEE